MNYTLQEKYANVSSYGYAVNDPIRFIDTDGKVIKLPKGTTYEQIFIVLGNIQNLTDDKMVFSTQKDGSIRIKIAYIRNGTKTAGTRLIQRINSSKRIMTINITSKTAAGNVQMNQSIESILRLALNWEQVNGIVINPFGKYIQI